MDVERVAQAEGGVELIGADGIETGQPGQGQSLEQVTYEDWTDVAVERLPPRFGHDRRFQEPFDHRATRRSPTCVGRQVATQAQAGGKSGGMAHEESDGERPLVCRVISRKQVLEWSVEVETTCHRQFHGQHVVARTFVSDARSNDVDDDNGRSSGVICARLTANSRPPSGAAGGDQDGARDDVRFDGIAQLRINVYERVRFRGL